MFGTALLVSVVVRAFCFALQVVAEKSREALDAALNAFNSAIKAAAPERFVCSSSLRESRSATGRCWKLMS